MYVSQWIGYHKYIRGTLSNSSIAASKDKKKYQKTKKETSSAQEHRDDHRLSAPSVRPSVRRVLRPNSHGFSLLSRLLNLVTKWRGLRGHRLVEPTHTAPAAGVALALHLDGEVDAVFGEVDPDPISDLFHVRAPHGRHVDDAEKLPAASGVGAGAVVYPELRHRVRGYAALVRDLRQGVAQVVLRVCGDGQQQALGG